MMDKAVPNAIARLRAEHVNLERLVRLLDSCDLAGATAQCAEVALLVDAIYYLTHFPDLSHHPLEDRIIARLRQHNGLPAALGAQIEDQHATLAQQGADLMRDLESAARGETMSWELVQANVRLYAERLRHNMAVEELALFPAALRQLDDDDWCALDAFMAAGQADPLFPAPTQLRFADLHRVIVAEANCDCEDT